MEEQKQITVTVSGGFDPIHLGHVRLMEQAKALGDRLVVIINNDNWLMKKKGFCFMPQDDRVEIIKALKCVDDAILTEHPENPEDMSVCDALRKLHPDIFANGGDRKKAGSFEDDDVPEYTVCGELGIRMVFNIGGEKTRSSSDMVRDAKAKEKKNKTNK